MTIPAVDVTAIYGYSATLNQVLKCALSSLEWSRSFWPWSSMDYLSTRQVGYLPGIFCNHYTCLQAWPAWSIWGLTLGFWRVPCNIYSIKEVTPAYITCRLTKSLAGDSQLMQCFSSSWHHCKALWHPTAPSVCLLVLHQLYQSSSQFLHSSILCARTTGMWCLLS